MVKVCFISPEYGLMYSSIEMLMISNVLTLRLKYKNLTITVPLQTYSTAPCTRVHDQGTSY